MWRQINKKYLSWNIKGTNETDEILQGLKIESQMV